MKIIGLGFQARSGKDTVADYLVRRYNFVQESFAGPLKEYIGRQICGFSDKQLWGPWKETVDPEWGMTPRVMLQKIGTDALRDVVHKDFWVIPMKRKIKEHSKNDRNVVISDMRFDNEIGLIKELGGKIIRINRKNPDQISSPKHISEVELDKYENWDYTVNNDSTFEELFLKIDEIMRKAE